MSDMPQPNRIDQVPAAYRHRVGDLLVTMVNDGHNVMPLKEGFVRGVGIDAMRAALAEAHLATDALVIPFTPLVVQGAGETVLIDTGYGSKGPATAGHLGRNMEAAGVRPDAVDHVLLSHFHGDHINGLLMADGDPAFPNARISVPEVEWGFWTDERRRAEAPEGLRANFENVARVLGPLRERVSAFAWDSEVLPGIRALDASGHTPGHTAFDIASRGERLMFIADVVNHPAFFVRNPSWSAVFDMDPEKAHETRRRFLGMLAREHVVCAGFHVPFPALVHIEADGERFRHVPVQWMAAV